MKDIKLFCVFGAPIHHSKSPILHNSVFRQYEDILDFRGLYGRYLLDRDITPSAFRQRCLSLQINGANITLPFKEIALLSSDTLSPAAREIGAVNTIHIQDDIITGDNTDAMGFYKSIESYGFKTALILGAGGAAKAIGYILKQNGFKILLANRSDARLRDFEKWEDKDFALTNSKDIKLDKFDILINTTSAGLVDDTLPLSSSMLDALLKESALALDIIYGKQTPFLALAKSLNIPTLDGRDMLINQAVFASKIFCQDKLDIDSIHKCMDKSFK